MNAGGGKGFVDGICPVAAECFTHIMQTKEAMEYWKTLPDIRNVLGDIRQNLMGPATSKHQVEIPFVMKLVGWICALSGLAIASLAILLIIQLSEERNVKVGPGGFEMSQPAEPAKKNPLPNE